MTHCEDLIVRTFDALSRKQGGCNLVSLTLLRAAVNLPRITFDLTLRSLRALGVLSLSQAEGRHGLTQADKDACIREGDNLLLYVSRRR